MDDYDLSFYEYSMIADDPKKLQALENHYYDPDYDEWEKEFDSEQAEKQTQKPEVQLETYEENPSPSTIDDWVKDGD